VCVKQGATGLRIAFVLLRVVDINRVHCCDEDLDRPLMMTRTGAASCGMVSRRMEELVSEMVASRAQLKLASELQSFPSEIPDTA